ncbi:MAG: hypothetical protein H8E46_11855 [FCB group bacterium]|nr:hypothetical protein [FCB group bacterium]
MKTIFILTVILLMTSSAFALDFFSTASVETFQTDNGETLISPNIFFTAGKFDGYGFWDRYLTDEAFYHGEVMLAYTPFEGKYLGKVSIISETRWDKYVDTENSIGLRVKLW